MERVLISEAQKADVAPLASLDAEALAECTAMALTQLSRREGIGASRKCDSMVYLLFPVALSQVHWNESPQAWPA